MAIMVQVELFDILRRVTNIFIAEKLLSLSSLSLKIGILLQ